jgi:flagellar biosynthesis anti-sigma factor FlgM
MPDPIQGVNTSGSVGATTSTGPVAPAKPADQTRSAVPADAASTAAAANAAPKADLADVYHTEALLQTILQAASTAPGIDQAKVAELQQAIATGAYQADPQVVAKKFMELESLLAAAGVVR